MVKTIGMRPYWVRDGIVFWSKQALLDYLRGQ